MKYSLLLIVAILFSCSDTSSPDSILEDGVQETLAQLRSEQVSSINYKLYFDIPNKREDPINSNLELTIDVIDIDKDVVLDFREETAAIIEVRINGEKVAIHHKKEHITLSRKYLNLGNNVITINFTAGELSLNRNEEFLYTLLVPDRARTLFPCFDQPNIKATYDLTMKAPKDWEVLAGARKLSSVANEEFVTHTFARSDKMSTYLFSFIAGKFTTEKQQRDAMEMTLLYRENDEKKIAYSRDSIFDLHQQSLAYLEDYTAFDFPFQKLDYAAIPGFQYGGMEHVGAIQYRESSLFLDETATTTRVLGRAKLIAHETAHMWFGDLVTMDWFNDVWMKEVFANFMADKIVNPNFPNINHELAFMTTHYPRAYNEDRTLGTNPIRQRLDNLSNAGSLYGAIIYNKAPIMMRQLEAVMEKEAFQKGIQEYIVTYQNGNATWPELVAILDKQTAVDIGAWSDAWVNNSSRPVFEERLEVNEEGTITNFTISQKAEDGSETLWPQSFDIDLVYEDRVETMIAKVTDSILYFPNLIGTPRPDRIVYNSNGFGYGVFPITDKEVNHLSSINDEVTRGYAYINSYENVLTGNLAVSVVLDSFRESITKESNQQLVNLLSGYINSLFWNYSSPEEREQLQPELAQELWDYLNTDTSSKLKKTIYVAFERVAYQGMSRDLLYDVWSKKLTVNDLKLNEDDFTAMASALALYQHPDADAILTEARNQISNPDKVTRFDFIRPSLSFDTATKKEFFISLNEEKNRAKESWVQIALSNLNHPLHQEEALVFVRPSLDLLKEIQETGDIFFPKGWLNSSVGRHTSKEAYDILQGYLVDNPNLKPSLRSKVLQASDDLRRIQELNQ